jgi:hypothetical protein
MLSKYHAVFLPLAAGLYIFLERPMRRWLFRPGPYLALGLGLVVFSPVIVWNAENGWVSFLFQGGRAIGSATLRPDYLLMALLAQALYLFPWIWAPLVFGLVRECRNWRRIPECPDRLFLCLAAVPLGVFTLVACFRPVLPHWGLIGFASLFPMAGRNWDERLERRPRASRRILAGCAAFSLALVGLTIVEFRSGLVQRGPGARWGLMEARNDPTLDLYGWDQVAGRIKQLGLLEEPGTFVFTRYWYQSAQLAHALGGAESVLCYNADDPRGFAFWSRPEEWVSHDGILVVVGEPAGESRYFGRWFARVEPVADFWVERSDKPVRRIGLFRCIRQRVAYPFAKDSARQVASAPRGVGVDPERRSR